MEGARRPLRLLTTQARSPLAISSKSSCCPDRPNLPPPDHAAAPAALALPAPRSRAFPARLAPHAGRNEGPAGAERAPLGLGATQRQERQRRQHRRREAAAGSADAAAQPCTAALAAGARVGPADSAAGTGESVCRAGLWVLSAAARVQPSLASPRAHRHRGVAPATNHLFRRPSVVTACIQTACITNPPAASSPPFPPGNQPAGAAAVADGALEEVQVRRGGGGLRPVATPPGQCRPAVLLLVALPSMPRSSCSSYVAFFLPSPAGVSPLKESLPVLPPRHPPTTTPTH